MGMSDLIAGFIQSALDDANGVLELQRSDLAQQFGCVPSQTLLMHVINSIGDTLDLPSARAIIQNLTESEAIDRAAGQALLSAVSDSALRTVPKEHRGPLRANICKQVLIHLV